MSAPVTLVPYTPEMLQLIDDQQKLLKERGIRYIQLQFQSLTGAYHCMEESADLYKEICYHGVGIDGSSLKGFAQLTNSDMTILPDPRTFLLGEMKDCRPFGYCMCSAMNNDCSGAPHAGCARSILARVIAKAKQMGFSAEMFGELEFYLFRKEGSQLVPMDEAGYCAMPPADQGLPFRHRLGDEMEKANCVVKRIHHEGSPGQNEVELGFTEAMRNADSMVRGMHIIKSLAAEFGFVASFSPKPMQGRAGSGLHEHTILRDASGRNVFSDPTSPDKLSTIAHQFIAGQIKYARDICSVFAVSDRSFERLKPGYEAPIWAAWDIANRSAVVRIPRIVPGTEGKTRIEFRAGDGSGCPYLLSASLLFAGLKGIEEQLPTPPHYPMMNFDLLTQQQAKEKHIAQLPTTMEESKRVLAESRFAQEMLGAHAHEFLTHYSYTEEGNKPMEHLWQPHH